MQQPSFSRPSADPAFTEQLAPKEQEMLQRLLGNDAIPAAEEPQRDGRPAQRGGEGRPLHAVPAPEKEERTKEDRSHRTTVWLSPVLQRRIRIRALERDQTVSAYLRELLSRDGIADDGS